MNKNYLKIEVQLFLKKEKKGLELDYGVNVAQPDGVHTYRLELDAVESTFILPTSSDASQSADGGVPELVASSK